MIPRRRMLIALATCALATPRGGLAQPSSRIRRVGFLALRRPVVLESDQFGAFAQGMRDLGYAEGRSLTIDWRFADGSSERLPDLAADLVRGNVEVILAAGTQAISAAQKATSSIPIVMAGANDPVGSGFVASLAHPGANITGLALLLEDVTPKQLEILSEAVPRLSRLAILGNPANASFGTLQSNVEAAARKAGIEVVATRARSPEDIDAAFATIDRERASAVIVASDALFTQQTRQIAALAEKHRLPVIGPFRQYVEAGALLSYGQNFHDHFRRAATYVDRILRGAKPSDLPVEQPTKFELAVNQKTARSLGLAISPGLLLRADFVVE